jgi:hypothetical protein
LPQSVGHSVVIVISAEQIEMFRQRKIKEKEKEKKDENRNEQRQT